MPSTKLTKQERAVVDIALDDLRSLKRNGLSGQQAKDSLMHSLARVEGMLHQMILPQSTMSRALDTSLVKSCATCERVIPINAVVCPFCCGEANHLMSAAR